MKCYTRKEIANFFEINEKTLREDMRQWETEILKLDSLYKEKQLLKPVVVRFIFEKYTGEDIWKHWGMD